MLFDCDRLQLQLLDVVSLTEKADVAVTRARPFYALSLRWDGKAEIRFGGNTEVLYKHDLALFHPNFSYTRHSENDCKIVFHFVVLNGERLNQETTNIEILRDFQFDVLFSLFENAYSLWSSKSSGYYFRCTAILYDIFALICQRKKQESTKDLPPLVATANHYLQQHFCEPDIMISDVAAFLNVSTSYLRRIFTNAMNISPKAYLCDLRMRRAQALLNTGYYCVSEVAEQVGYRDPKNFATAYKKYCGCPPSAQRYEEVKGQ